MATLLPDSGLPKTKAPYVRGPRWARQRLHAWAQRPRNPMLYSTLRGAALSIELGASKRIVESKLAFSSEGSAKLPQLDKSSVPI